MTPFSAPPRLASDRAIADPAPYRPLRRLQFLDSLRGLAAVYVVLYHIWLASAEPVALGPWLRLFVGFGDTGVFLFFVISGFSLAMTMPRHVATGRPMLSFAVSRFFRIAPLFYVLLAYMVARTVSNGYGLQPRTVAANATFLFNLFPGKQGGIVMASWTIGVEMLFYAAFPVLIVLRPGVQMLVVIACQLLFLVMLRYLSPTYNALTVVGCIPLFFLGIWAHGLLELLRGAGPDKRRFGWMLVLIGLCVLVGCALFRTEPELGFFVCRALTALGYVMILLGLGLQAPGTFGMRVLILLGRISYSTYLLHSIIITSLDRSLIAYTAHMPGDLAYGVRLLVVLALLIPAAVAANVLIERPAERYGLTLIQRMTGSPQRALVRA